MADTLGVDVPRQTPAEALTLMIHHLQLAAAYFELTDEDIAWVVRRDMGEGPSADAAQAWLRAMEDAYSALA